jgi:hypothetical protein
VRSVSADVEQDPPPLPPQFKPPAEDPLTCLRRLVPHLNDDDLDLNAIDGEFYWRCCAATRAGLPLVDSPLSPRRWAELRESMVRVIDGPVFTAHAQSYFDRLFNSLDDDLQSQETSARNLSACTNCRRERNRKSR